MKHKEAYDFLERPSRLAVILRNKQLELERWEAMATSMTNGGQSVLVPRKSKDGEVKMELQNMAKVQSSGNPNKMTDAADRCMELEVEIASYRQQLKEAEVEVLSLIEKLPTTEYDVLHKLYILGWPPARIMEQYDRGESWVSSTKGRGVKMVQEYLAG